MILREETEKIGYPNDGHILECLESKKVVVAGDDQISAGLKRAFQDAVIRKVVESHDLDRRCNDRRRASDEFESDRHIIFTLMKLRSEDARGFLV